MKQVNQSKDEYLRKNFVLLDSESITEQFVVRQLYDLIELLNKHIDDSVGKTKADYKKRREMVGEVMHMYRLMHYGVIK
jgi:hypothetical protein